MKQPSSSDKTAAAAAAFALISSAAARLATVFLPQTRRTTIVFLSNSCFLVFSQVKGTYNTKRLKKAFCWRLASRMSSIS